MPYIQDPPEYDMQTNEYKPTTWSWVGPVSPYDSGQLRQDIRNADPMAYPIQADSYVGPVGLLSVFFLLFLGKVALIGGAILLILAFDQHNGSALAGAIGAGIVILGILSLVIWWSRRCGDWNRGFPIEFEALNGQPMHKVYGRSLRADGQPAIQPDKDRTKWVTRRPNQPPPSL